MQLFLLVLGRQQRTQRRSERPGGRRFTSKLDTGDLTLVVFGSVPRDSRQLVHDVNALQVGLRDQFRRVQAQRSSADAPVRPVSGDALEERPAARCRR